MTCERSACIYWLCSCSVPTCGPTGTFHTCAVTTDNKVRCWGSGSLGRLGYGNSNNVGDGVGVSIDTAGDVPVGAGVSQVDVGGAHTCAVTTGNNVRCWGNALDGQLGYGNTTTVGDGIGPSIDTASDVPVGADVMQVSAGNLHTCAVTTGNNVRCWGEGDFGKLGYASTDPVGDGVGLSIMAAGDINDGVDVKQVSAGFDHTCVVTIDNNVRCWGNGSLGRLGCGNTNVIGDDETPATAFSTGTCIEQSLPVEWTDFTARISGGQIHLTWTTASETNNTGFEVHRLFERSG